MKGVQDAPFLCKDHAVRMSGKLLDCKLRCECAQRMHATLAVLCEKEQYFIAMLDALLMYSAPPLSCLECSVQGAALVWCNP